MAKNYFGHSDYNRRCRNREFIFYNDRCESGRDKLNTLCDKVNNI